MKATVTFVGGQGAEGVDPYVWGAFTFPLNEPVAIDGSESDFAAHVIRKARNNRFFAVADEAKPEQDVKAFAAFDHNGDGKPGGSLPKAKRAAKKK
jgi:hypothetical protein